MELYKEILQRVFEREEINVTFPNLSLDPGEVVESECYKALQKIRAVLDDDTLDDPECFDKIEEIVCIFERLGSGGGARHDFG